MTSLRSIDVWLGNSRHNDLWELIRQGWSTIGIAVIVAAGLILPAQAQKKSAPEAKGNNPTIQSPATSSQSAPTSASSPLVSPTGKASSTEYPADYIPCVFTVPELLGLRLMPVSATLTSAEEEDLKEQLISEVTAQANSGGLTEFMKSEFYQLLGSASFEGLTPSQALAKVIDILHEIEIPLEQLKAAARDVTADRLVNLVQLQLPMQVLNPVPENGRASSDKSIVENNLKADMDKKKPGLERVIQMETNVLGALSGVEYSYYQFPAAQQNLTRSLQAVENDLEAEEARPGGGAKNNSGNEENAQDIAIQAIVERARSTIKESFQRPQDVGCAMSILSWNEARYAFGRLIANEYIGVQIVVRNLNDKQEFSLHDAELSVDTELNGRFGRFYSGRDKLIVRGLSLAQADYTPRNIFVHLAEAAGTVMSAALPVAGNVFKDATGVYNGGFLPGLKTTWTDHSVDQLNLLSDIGFSSSTNYKTVVPKSGSVMFVIFIPSKQFDQGWWVQSCAEHISFRAKSTSSKASSFSVFAESVTSQPKPANVGVDLDVARELCREYRTVAGEPTGSASSSKSTGNTSGQTESPDTSTGKTSGQVQEAATVPSVADVPYRKWSPIALSIFRELAWAVVAGIHIQEAQNQSAITQLNCPTDDLGNILFNKTGTLSCDIAGEGLDKVATLRLRNAQDATDTDTADGPVTVSGDATKAKVTFQLSKLGGLNKPAYKVYTVTTTGVEAFANQTVHFDLNPFVTDLSPATADPSKQSSMPFTIKGFHLDKIAKVQLFEGAYKSGATSLLQYGLDSGGTATQAAFTVKATDDDLKKKASEESGETLAVELLVTNSSGSPVNGGSISLKSTVLKSTVLISSEAISFDPQNVKTTSVAKPVTLNNSGATELTGLDAKIAGANPASFSQANACEGKVAAGAPCVFNVKFAPTSAGKLAATLSITYTVGGSQQSQSVSLAGTGKVPGSAATTTLSPETLTFSKQRSKTTSSAKVITLTNSGATALTGFAAKITGTNANSFGETNTCGNSVAAHAKCVFNVKFAPTSAGKLAATLSITYTVGGSQQSQSVSLAGTGTP